MDVIGTILQDALGRDTAVYYAVERDDNFLGISDAQSYFVNPPLGSLEAELVDQLYGDILELACGAGRISLYLQNKGFHVMATDISEGALEVCKTRGIRYSKQLDIMNPKNLLFLTDKYDFVIIFGNSIPLLHNQEKMVEFLNNLWNVTTPNGKVMGDFISPLPTQEQYHLDYHQNNRESGHPIGRLKFRMRYKIMIGNWIEFWIPTPDEFKACVANTNWNVKLQNEGNHYFFILSKD